MAKKKKGRRKWVCLTTVKGSEDPTDFPTPYSDPFDYALRKKRGLKRNSVKWPPREYFYIVDTGGGEFIGIKVTTAKELEVEILKLKKEKRFSNINGPFPSQKAAREALRYM